MSQKRITYPLIGLSFLLIGLMIAVGLRSQTGGLAGRKIVRALEGLRVLVSMDWTVQVNRTGTMFSNSEEAWGSPGPAFGRTGRRSKPYRRKWIPWICISTRSGPIRVMRFLAWRRSGLS
jgi:hypothetical protein